MSLILISNLSPERREEEGGEKDCTNCGVKKLALTSFEHLSKKFTQNAFRAKKKVTAVVPPNPERKKWVLKAKMRDMKY